MLGGSAHVQRPPYYTIRMSGLRLMSFRRFRVQRVQCDKCGRMFVHEGKPGILVLFVDAPEKVEEDEIIEKQPEGMSSTECG